LIKSVVYPDPLFGQHEPRIVEFVAKSRMPSLYGYRGAVEAGGLMAYGVNDHEQFRRAVSYVAKSLKDTKPGELPIQQPAIFELVINLKTALALDLRIPPALLFQADEVIR
jgi:putative ABC transport system substrate-binding protein